MIWYHIEKNILFLSGELDAHFFGLIGGIDWNKVEIIDYADDL